MKFLKNLVVVITMLNFTAFSTEVSRVAPNEDGDSEFRPKVVNFVIWSCMWEIGCGFVKSTEIWKSFQTPFFIDKTLEDSLSVVSHPLILDEEKDIVLVEGAGAIETSLKRSPAASKLCMLGNTETSEQDDNFLPSIILPPAFTDEEQDLSILSQLPNRRRSISGDSGWGFYGNISPGGRFYKDCQITVH
jgi:hypothetical protein